MPKATNNEGNARCRVRESRSSPWSESTGSTVWLPRSEYATNPSPGKRRDTAISKASTTSRLVIRSPIDQPTISREYKSSTTARYRQPSRVGMYVRSATQTWLIATGSNCRNALGTLDGWPRSPPSGPPAVAVAHGQGDPARCSGHWGRPARPGTSAAPATGGGVRR
jgi:hypothetical protein